MQKQTTTPKATNYKNKKNQKREWYATKSRNDSNNNKAAIRVTLSAPIQPPFGAAFFCLQ